LSRLGRSEPSPQSPDFARWLRRTLRREDFNNLPKDDAEALRRFAVREDHARGVELFRQGEAPRAIFIVEQGEVELLYVTTTERLIVQVIGAGSSVGELPVMLETPYAYTAVTRVPTTTLRFGLETVQTLIEIHPHICFRWLRLVSRRLERAQRRLVELAGKSAFEQVAHFLLHELQERRTSAVEMTQADMARALGLSRQSVSRALGELSDLGIIARHRGRIEILDRQKLINHVPR
jgi:CRP/FNR family transcriptional regulator